mmetsp:Transcript_124049/g.322248  ORF Transcript_124049/g.322248 Transcript_124049/m.322248 type:complete len:620 (-) Transcript_124049:314-2173(-)
MWRSGENRTLLQARRLESCEKLEYRIEEDDEQKHDSGDREAEQGGMVSWAESTMPLTLIFIPVVVGCALPCADVSTDYGQALPAIYNQNRSKFRLQVIILVASSMCGASAYVVDHSLWSKLRINTALKAAVVLGIFVVFPLFPFSVLSTACVAWVIGDVGLLEKCQAVVPIIAAGEALEAFLSFALQSDAFFVDKVDGLLFSLACGLLSLCKIGVEHNVAKKVFWSCELGGMMETSASDRVFPIVTGPLKGLTASWWRTLMLGIHSILEIASGTGCLVLFHRSMHDTFWAEQFGCSFAWSVLYGLEVAALLLVFVLQAPYSITECARSALTAPIFIPLSILDSSMQVLPSYIVRLAAQGTTFLAVTSCCRGKTCDIDGVQATMAMCAWLTGISTCLMWLTLTVLRSCGSYSTLQTWQTEACEEAAVEIMTLLKQRRNRPVAKDIRLAQSGHPAARHFFNKLADKIKMEMDVDGEYHGPGDRRGSYQDGEWLVPGDENFHGVISASLVLPADWSELHSVKTLSIDDCNTLTSLPPEFFRRLKSLKALHFRACPSLSSLPEEVGQLELLEDLTFENCDALTTVPVVLAQMPSLKRLYFRQCWSSVQLLPEQLLELDCFYAA